MSRVSRFLGQLESRKQSQLSGSATYGSSSKSPDDIVIVSLCRTAIGKAGRGNFAKLSATELLAPVLKKILDETQIDPALVGDVVMGTVLAPGAARASEVRMAGFLAGLPDTVPVRTVNRQCSSGLQAIADVASAIKSGFYNVGIAGGVESMSSDLKHMRKPEIKIPDSVKQNGPAMNVLLPMGITSENVAEKYGITRQQQDELAVISNSRAIAARARMREEIVPITVTVTNRKTGELQRVTVRDDEGPRPGTSVATLAKLRPAFKKTGSTTGGNASQVSDGAAAALLMKRSTAQRLRLPVKAVFKHFAVSGCAPEIMGVGPAVAIPAVLKQAGLTTRDIDLYEINEAFASQATYCVDKLGLTMDNVNVNGGAIALGHPLGMTGARMTVTLVNELRRRGQKRGIVSMCIGSGMGAAGIFELD